LPGIDASHFTGSVEVAIVNVPAAREDFQVRETSKIESGTRGLQTQAAKVAQSVQVPRVDTLLLDDFQVEQIRELGEETQIRDTRDVKTLTITVFVQPLEIRKRLFLVPRPCRHKKRARHRSMGSLGQF
jgi:hypothetical protein